MKRIQSICLFLITAFLVSSCGGNEEKASQSDLSATSWEEIKAQAAGTTVNFMMWQGDPFINRYMQDFVVPQVKELYNIELNLLNGQGNQVVSTVITELEAGKSQSELDMCWINGETFYQLRQVNGLYGPFTDKLPNTQYVDFENPFIKYDFQQEVSGYECPWGNVQLAIIYDSKRVNDPPKDLDMLAKWVKAHPGQFTIENGFTGMTLLKSWLIAMAQAAGDDLNGDFDEKKYVKYSAELWSYINGVKSNFWRSGNTFPANVAQMHQLYADGELAFTYSNNDSEVDNKIALGVFPESSRSYVYESGTIQNSHFLGITKKAANREGAMTVINFMISPEAQLQKYDPNVWGDGTILAIDKLPKEWKEKFENNPARKYAPKRSEIQQYALMEPAAEYMIRLSEDFRKKVIEAN